MRDQTTAQMPKARLARASDPERLLDLFRVSEVSSIAEPPHRVEHIWSETLTRKGVAVLVSDAGARIVATCMLVTAPNLLRRGRGHAFLENVVTDPGFRGLGHGRAVVRAAVTEADWSIKSSALTKRKTWQRHRYQGWSGESFGLIIAEAINAATAAEYSSNPLKS